MADSLIDPALLEIMQCPNCTGALTEQREPPELVCGDCGYRYAVVDGIPNMVVEDATKP